MEGLALRGQARRALAPAHVVQAEQHVEVGVEALGVLGAAIGQLVAAPQLVLAAPDLLAEVAAAGGHEPVPVLALELERPAGLAPARHGAHHVAPAGGDGHRHRHQHVPVAAVGELPAEVARRGGHVAGGAEHGPGRRRPGADRQQQRGAPARPAQRQQAGEAAVRGPRRERQRLLPRAVVPLPRLEPHARGEQAPAALGERVPLGLRDAVEGGARAVRVLRSTDHRTGTGCPSPNKKSLEDSSTFGEIGFVAFCHAAALPARRKTCYEQGFLAHGRGWARTSDLSRVKRALSH